MDIHGSEKGIAFAIRYDGAEAQCVDRVWVWQNETIESIDVDEAVGRQLAAGIKRLATTFAFLAIVRDMPQGSTPASEFASESWYVTLMEFMMRALNCKASLALLSLPVLMTSQDEVRAIRTNKTRGVYHPFLSKWFYISKANNQYSLTLKPGVRDHARSPICFFNTDVVPVERLDRSFSEGNLPNTGLVHSRQLLAIIRAFEARKSRTVNKPIAIPSHSTPWISKYFQLAKSHSQLQAPKHYIEPRVMQYRELMHILSFEEEQSVDDVEFVMTETAPVTGECLSLLSDESAVRCVLLGEPGSGKTSSLLAYCQALLHRPPASDDIVIPIFVDLTGTVESPDALYRDSLRSAGISEKQVKKVKHLRVALLCDGLDRISPSIHTPTFVCELFSLYDPNTIYQIVLTCKTSDWNDYALRELDALVLCILPFSDRAGGEISLYLDSRLGADSSDMRAALRSHPELRQQAKSPQQLELICDLAEEGKSSSLPSSVFELMQLWVKQKISVQDYKGGRWYSHAERLLSLIAHFMTSRQLYAITRSELIDHLGTVRFTEEQEDPLELAKDAGILSSAGFPARDELVRFIHQEFQHFYAALLIRKELVDFSEAKLLAYLQHKKWDDPLVLACDTLEYDVAKRVVSTTAEHNVFLSAQIATRNTTDNEEVEEVLLGSNDSDSILTYDTEAGIAALFSLRGHPARYVQRDIFERNPARCLEALEFFHPRACFAETLKFLLEHSNDHASNPAFAALVTYYPTTMEAEILTLCQKPEFNEMVEMAILSLPQVLNEDRCAEILSDLMKDSDRSLELRETAATALGSLRSTTVSSTLRRLIAEKTIAPKEMSEMLHRVNHEDPGIIGEIRLWAVIEGHIPESDISLNILEATCIPETIFDVFCDTTQSRDVRLFAGRYMRYYAGSFADAREFAKVLSDKDPKIAAAALTVVDKINPCSEGADTIVPLLRELYSSARRTKVREKLAARIILIRPSVGPLLLMDDVVKGKAYAAKLLHECIFSRGASLRKNDYATLARVVENSSLSFLTRGAALSILQPLLRKNRIAALLQLYVEQTRRLLSTDDAYDYIQALESIMKKSDLVSWLQEELSKCNKVRSKTRRTNILEGLAGVCDETHTDYINELLRDDIENYDALSHYLSYDGNLESIRILLEYLMLSQLSDHQTECMLGDIAMIYEELNKRDRKLAYELLRNFMGQDVDVFLRRHEIEEDQRYLKKS